MTNQTPNQELEIRSFTDEKLSDKFVNGIQNMIRLAKAQGAKEERERILNLPKMKIEQVNSTDFPIRDKQTRNQLRRLVIEEIESETT